jgi:beta-lactamase regulating signal transducer with metallopeptidase domain
MTESEGSKGDSDAAIRAFLHADQQQVDGRPLLAQSTDIDTPMTMGATWID